MNSLWQEHKLNAMDNPYGTCHARLKGDCPYMEAPPCLTCNSGKPCKDLAIGFSNLDVEKHVNLLEKYEDILKNIKDGNFIFGRNNRMKK
ncbi:hypothetical protein ACUXS1_001499 [Staphylococcus warneri]